MLKAARLAGKEIHEPLNLEATLNVRTCSRLRQTVVAKSIYFSSRNLKCFADSTKETLVDFTTCDINAYVGPLIEICQPAGVKIGLVPK